MRFLMNTKHRLILTKLLTLVLVSRTIFIGLILWINGSQGVISPDTTTYVAPAGSLLHGTFSSGHGPELLRTPGYPLLLCLAIASGRVVFAAIVANLMLAAVTA